MTIDYDEYARHLNTLQYRQDAEWKASQLMSVIPADRTFDSVLDVGCGPGLVMKFLGDRLGIPDRLGVDVSTEMLVLAGANQQDAEFRILDVEKGNLPWGYDLIILSDILEHIEHPEILLKQAVSSGSDVVVKIPAEWGLRNRSVDGHAGGHTQLWKVHHVTDMLSHLGFSEWRVVDPPWSIQFRNWKLKMTLHPLYWVATAVNLISWWCARPVWRALYGTTIVGYYERVGLR